MKKLLLAAAGLTALAALGAVLPFTVVQAQQPGSQSAEPFAIPIGQPSPGSGPPYLPTTPGSQKMPQLPPPPDTELPGGTPKSAGSGFPVSTAAIFAGQPKPGTNGFQQPGSDSEKPSILQEFLRQDFDGPDPNQDIAVNPKCGNWVVYVHWYSGKDAPKMARDMVLELRTNPQYKLNAYVFRKGVEECRAEQKRIKEEIERQRALLVQRNLPADTPVRVPLVRYEVQYAVLVGGYNDMEAARRDVDRLKKLPPPDPRKVMLDTEYVVKCDDKGVPKDGDYAPINPFSRLMAFPNPALQSKATNANNTEDLATLQRLNADESYSLLKCPKKYTLAVKQFSLGVEIQPQKGSSSMFSVPNLFKTNQQDPAAISAHNLARVLQDNKQLEVYVLHTKYASFVTVGSYDHPDDPRLQRDQDLLPQVYQQIQQQLQLAARPVVMQVPK